MSDGTTTERHPVTPSRLRDAVNDLQLTLNTIESALADDQFIPPALAQDASGRYILLDAQIALVNGYAALERAR